MLLCVGTRELERQKQRPKQRDMLRKNVHCTSWEQWLGCSRIIWLFGYKDCNCVDKNRSTKPFDKTVWLFSHSDFGRWHAIANNRAAMMHRAVWNFHIKCACLSVSILRYILCTFISFEFHSIIFTIVLQIQIQIQIQIHTPKPQTHEHGTYNSILFLRMS